MNEKLISDHQITISPYLPLLCLREVGVVPRDDAEDPDREGPLGGVSGGPGGGEERCDFLGGLSGGIGCSTTADSPGRGGNGSRADARGIAMAAATASGLYILARSFR